MVHNVSQKSKLVEEDKTIVFRVQPGTFMHQLIVFAQRTYGLPSAHEAIRLALTKLFIEEYKNARRE
jgi:hypothetical protein